MRRRGDQWRQIADAIEQANTRVQGQRATRCAQRAAQSGLSWGIFAPAGTPPDIVGKLNQAFKRALAERGVEEVFGTNAVVPGSTSPQELAKLVNDGLVTTRKLVKTYNIPPE